VRGRAEIWHFYAGASVELTISEWSPGDPAARTTTLGIDLDAAERPQAIVPAGWWQRARTLGEWSLVGCTVAPPFSFDAFELAPPS
jgi:predicted cupin superfamily sugar epimerase